MNQIFMSQLQKFSQLQRFFVPFDFKSISPGQQTVKGVCPTDRLPGAQWGLTASALKRSALGYLISPVIRSMDGNVSAGKGLSVEFDDQDRVVIEAKIVDGNEWNKVLEGVYRGFLISGRPELVRGSNIDKFNWIETSLVDRPCDLGRFSRCVLLERRENNATPAPNSYAALEAARDLVRLESTIEKNDVKRTALVATWMSLDSQLRQLTPMVGNPS